MLNKDRFVMVMTGLCDMYGKEISEFILDMYYDIFKDYTIEQFENSVKCCIKDRVYNSVPKPADILSHLEGTKDDRALVAWLQVMEAIKKGGYYASIEFADPIIPNCIDELGGWQYLCCSKQDDLCFIEKRFMDLYRLLLKRGNVTNKKIMGFIETQNSGSGHFENIPDTIKIGFEEPKQIGN